MWQLAGTAGLDPNPLTLRELISYAEARATAQWDHTAMLLALTFNCHRAPKTRPARMETFHPYRRPARRGMTVEAVKAMRPAIEAMRMRSKPT